MEEYSDVLNANQLKYQQHYQFENRYRTPYDITTKPVHNYPQAKIRQANFPPQGSPIRHFEQTIPYPHSNEMRPPYQQTQNFYQTQVRSPIKQNLPPNYQGDHLTSSPQLREASVPIQARPYPMRRQSGFHPQSPPLIYDYGAQPDIQYEFHPNSPPRRASLIPVDPVYRPAIRHPVVEMQVQRSPPDEVWFDNKRDFEKKLLIREWEKIIRKKNNEKSIFDIGQYESLMGQNHFNQQKHEDRMEAPTQNEQTKWNRPESKVPELKKIFNEMEAPQDSEDEKQGHLYYFQDPNQQSDKQHSCDASHTVRNLAQSIEMHQQKNDIQPSRKEIPSEFTNYNPNQRIYTTQRVIQFNPNNLHKVGYPVQYMYK